MSYTVTCLTTLSDAEKAWDLLSPHEALMDEWMYRYLYYQYNPKPLHFYQLEKNGTPVALLPLQKNSEGILEFFGGEKFYRNSIFMHDTNPESYKRLFAAIHQPMNLVDMNEPIPGYSYFEQDVGYYVLDLEGISDWHAYLEKDWQGKSKKNIKSQMRKIEALGIEIVENDSKDLALLAEFNLAKFQQYSHFNKANRIDYLKDLINHFEAKMLTIIVDGKKSAVGFGILHKNRYYGLTSGHDLSIKNLGKYLIMRRIDQAIQSGADSYEAGRHDYGWKENFHFIKKNLYRLQ